jgi:hypothetical protein
MTDPKPPSDRDEPQDEKWYERTRYQVLLFAGGVVLFGLVLWFVLDWYIDPRTSTEKKDLVQALGLITAGVAGAVGILFTWRGQRITQREQERNQRNTQEQLRLARQSQEDNQRKYPSPAGAIPHGAGHHPAGADHGALHAGHRSAR